MTNSPNASYQRRILATKGLSIEDLHSDDIKTPMMKWFEFKFGAPIEHLLRGSLTECAQRLGTNKSTISKWKKRLGLDQQYLQEHTYQPNDEDPNVEAVS